MQPDHANGNSPDIEEEGASVVLLGAFNPKILQPSWLVSNKLVDPGLEQSADIHVITNNVSSISMEWFTMEVTKDRFQLSSADPGHYPLLRDLAVGIFSLLKHTPCSKMGINRSMHIRMPSHGSWHALGDLLAPKALWNTVLSHNSPKLDRDSVGLLSLTVLGNRPNATSEGVQVTVEPSSRFKPDGVFLRSNETYSIENISSAMNILENQWLDALAFAEDLIRRVVVQGCA